MTKFKVISLTTLLAMGLCWSCSFNNVEEDVKVDICPSDTVTVSFQDTILPIITKYCSNSANGDCHQAGATTRPPMTNHAEISGLSTTGRIQARVFDQTPSPMPPANSLGEKAVSECDKILIQRWMAAGSPDN